MRILAVTPKTLLPIESGLELRIFNLLKPLCSIHEISLLCFNQDNNTLEEDTKQLKTLFRNIRFVDLESGVIKKTPIFKRIRECFFPRNVPFGKLSLSDNMNFAVKSEVEAKKYDLIFIASPYMVNYFLSDYGVPVVFDAIDDTSLLMGREISQKTKIIEKLKAFKDWLEIRQVEKLLYSRFTEIVLTSPIDAKIMRNMCPKSNVTVIPNGVEIKNLEYVKTVKEENTLIFTGVMNYAPNVSAMLYFCENILPLVKKTYPSIKILIVGRKPTEEIKNLSQKYNGVEVTGEVDEVWSYLKRATVYICPLISGAGIKNKILEAWVAGIPIVATSLSCDGIDVTHGRDVLVGDTPPQFAEHIINLIEDKNLSHSLAKSGRLNAENNYGWKSKSLILESVFNKAVR